MCSRCIDDVLGPANRGWRLRVFLLRAFRIEPGWSGLSNVLSLGAWVKELSVIGVCLKGMWTDSVTSVSVSS